jgi:hypothetical protein
MLIQFHFVNSLFFSDEEPQLSSSKYILFKKLEVANIELNTSQPNANNYIILVFTQFSGNHNQNQACSANILKTFKTMATITAITNNVVTADTKELAI